MELRTLTKLNKSVEGHDTIIAFVFHLCGMKLKLTETERETWRSGGEVKVSGVTLPVVALGVALKAALPD